MSIHVQGSIRRTPLKQLCTLLVFAGTYVLFVVHVLLSGSSSESKWMEVRDVGSSMWVVVLAPPLPHTHTHWLNRPKADNVFTAVKWRPLALFCPPPPPPPLPEKLGMPMVRGVRSSMWVVMLTGGSLPSLVRLDHRVLAADLESCGLTLPSPPPP